jgi:hypothetical protein
LKPVAWAKKNAPIFIGASLPKQIIVARIYSIHPRSKTRMVSNRFWHIVSVVKERAPLSSRKALLQPKEYLSSPPLCQHCINVFHSLPQGTASALTGRTSHLYFPKDTGRKNILVSKCTLHVCALFALLTGPSCAICRKSADAAPSQTAPLDSWLAHDKESSSLSHQAHAI